MKHNKHISPQNRSNEQLKKHYEVERRIARKLKNAGKEERKKIYKTMYDELFEKVPDHPRLIKREDPKVTAANNRSKFVLLQDVLDKSKILLEFGSGCCSFAMKLCNHVKRVYAIDISDQRLTTVFSPKNLEVIIYNGYDLNLPDASIDIIFSDQLIEHLHPEDVYSHFQLAKRLLKPNGVYIFRTPHRYSGPYDISRYFSNTAEGFHLKEWTYTEIATVLNNLFYYSYRGYWYGKKFRVQLPFVLFTVFEKMIQLFPGKLAKIISRKTLPYITMAAIKK